MKTDFASHDLLTLEQVDELAGWPEDSQRVLASVAELRAMAREHAARRLCETLLPKGWKMTLHIPSGVDYWARAEGSDADGSPNALGAVGVTAADAYAALAAKLPGGRP